MRIFRRFTIAVAAMFVATAASSAQGTEQAATAPDTTVAARVEQAPPAEQVSQAPLVSNLGVGVKAHAAAPAAPYALPAPQKGSNNVAMMIVGGAMLVGGAIISSSNNTAGTLIMVGGVAIGAIGLYRYLQ